MEAIVTTLITAISSIIVAVLTLRTNNKIKKISDLKEDFKSDMEATRKELLAKMETLEKTIDKNDIDAVRNRISAFDQLCRLDVKHNSIQMHQYNTAFKDIDKWKIYHKKYPKLNGEIDVAISNIKDNYKMANF